MGAALLSDGYERPKQASLAARKPLSLITSSLTNTSSAARITLPSDLSGSLKYLDAAQLERLLEAVSGEIERRNQPAPKPKTIAAPAARTPSQVKSTEFHDKKLGESDQIPEGRANLIRASFKAGIKPATIARTFRISKALVNRILSSVEKPR